jgi:hypothetical protein
MWVPEDGEPAYNGPTHMEKLVPVEDAKMLLSSARDWSIVRWLAEKRKVRRIADLGTSALDEAERRVKSGWSEELLNAYAELCPPGDDDPFAASEFEFIKQHANGIPESIKQWARRVKEADDKAYEARMTAERTFDDAERKLSAALARRGADEAIQAYELRYTAIAAAETARDA